MSDTIVPAGAVVPAVPEVTQEPTGVPVVPPAGNPPKGFTAEAPAPVAPTAPADEVPQDLTGNTALDTAISTFVAVTGASMGDVQRAVAKAVEYGNVDLIDTQFLTERFGKYSAQAIDLAKAAVQDSFNRQSAAISTAKSTVHAAAGSEQNWNQATSVFNSTANPTIKAAVKALMDTGNIKDGAELLLSTVRGSGLLPNTHPTLNGGGVSAGSTGALSAQQFKAELAELRKIAGNQSLETGPNAERYTQLIARRSAGKQLGL